MRFRLIQSKHTHSHSHSHLQSHVQIRNHKEAKTRRPKAPYGSQREEKKAKSPLWESTGKPQAKSPLWESTGKKKGQKPPMGVEPIFFASGGAPAASHGHTRRPQNSIGPQARYDRQRALVTLNWPLFSPGVSRVARERVIHGLKPHATCSVHLLHLRMLSYPYHFNMCMCMLPLQHVHVHVPTT